MQDPAKTYATNALIAALVPPLALCVIGILMLFMAYTQPAWIDNRIGPGLFAHWLAKGIIILSVIWAALSAIRAPRRRDYALSATATNSSTARPSWTPGLSLLSAVAAFIFLMPGAGMVIACAITASIAGWGAGDRRWYALAITAAIAGMIAYAIGVTLLPPTIRLWPWSPFGHG